MSLPMHNSKEKFRKLLSQTTTEEKQTDGDEKKAASLVDIPFVSILSVINLLVWGEIKGVEEINAIDLFALLKKYIVSEEIKINNSEITKKLEENADIFSTFVAALNSLLQTDKNAEAILESIKVISDISPIMMAQNYQGGFVYSSHFLTEVGAIWEMFNSKEEEEDDKEKEEGDEEEEVGDLEFIVRYIAKSFYNSEQMEISNLLRIDTAFVKDEYLGNIADTKFMAKPNEFNNLKKSPLIRARLFTEAYQNWSTKKQRDMLEIIIDGLEWTLHKYLDNENINYIDAVLCLQHLSNLDNVDANLLSRIKGLLEEFA